MWVAQKRLLGLTKQTAPSPWGARAAIARVMSNHLPTAYHIQKIANGYNMLNRAHNLKIEFRSGYS